MFLFLNSHFSCGILLCVYFYFALFKDNCLSLGTICISVLFSTEDNTVSLKNYVISRASYTFYPLEFHPLTKTVVILDIRLFAQYCGSW